MQQNYVLWQAEQSFDPSELERIDFGALERIEDSDLSGLRNKESNSAAEVA